MKWITREKVKVDRVACPWLIKKFVDKDAEFVFVPGEKVMTSAAALFLLIAAAGSPGSVLGRAGGVPGFGWLMITISGVGLAWKAGSHTIWPPLAARPTTSRPANSSPESRSDQLDRDMRASPSSEMGAPIAIDVSVTSVFPPATFSPS